MKDQEQGCESIADQHGDAFLLLLVLLVHRETRLIQADFSACIRENHQVIVGGFLFQLGLAVRFELLLGYMLGALHIRELFYEFRDLVVSPSNQLLKCSFCKGRQSRQNQECSR